MPMKNQIKMNTAEHHRKTLGTTKRTPQKGRERIVGTRWVEDIMKTHPTESAKWDS